MQETYITLEEAARFEGISYKGLTSRISRNPARYKTRTEAREGGGKELVLLSTASLSQKGRRAYRAQNPGHGGAGGGGRDGALVRGSGPGQLHRAAQAGVLRGGGAGAAGAGLPVLRRAGPDRIRGAAGGRAGRESANPVPLHAERAERPASGHGSWKRRTGTAGTTSGRWRCAGSPGRRPRSPA